LIVLLYPVGGQHPLLLHQVLVQQTDLATSIQDLSDPILTEARQLANSGVKELNVIAQDTTRYGEDIYGKLMLP
ncbi:MAG: hypothetical protein II008_06755, partial [Oscillospiraceae bacterium]|nr:hypothetical protein [Oscillospiraceae bacterium]